MTTPVNLVRLHRQRTGRVAIGPSTARRMGEKGMIRAAQTYLGHRVNLGKLGKSGANFGRVLDQETSKFLSHLKKYGAEWGSARKFLNIFIRDAVYDFELRAKFGLSKIHDRCELPLDRKCTERLTKYFAKHGQKLPRWHGVKQLTPADSSIFQGAANDLAKSLRISRVDLDMFFWLGLELPQRLVARSKRRRAA